MFEDIFDEMRKLQMELNRDFGNFFENESYKALPGPTQNKNALVRSPLTDLEETDKEVIAKIELPGVDKKDIQLNITENRVEVKVEKRQEAKVEEKGFYRMERSYSGFYRALPLPSGVIPARARAKYKDGILELTMPKQEEKKKNKIEIE